MERMFSRIMVVEDNINNLILLEDKGVGVHTINLRLSCVRACCEGCEKSRDFGSYVSYTIEEGTWIC